MNKKREANVSEANQGNQADSVNSLMLGIGVDGRNGSVFHQALTETTIDSALQKKQPEAVFDCKWQSDSRKIKDALNVNASVSASYGLFNASAKTGYNDVKESEGFSKKYFYAFRYVGGNRDYILVPSERETDCTKAFNSYVDDGDIERFQEIYGDTYVSTTREGVLFTAKLSIHFDSYGSASTFSASASAGGGLGLFSGEVAAGMEKSHQENRCNATIQLHLSQSGGRPERITQVVSGLTSGNPGAQNGETSVSSDISTIRTFFSNLEKNLGTYIGSLGEQLGPNGEDNLYVTKCNTTPYPSDLFSGSYGNLSKKLISEITDLYFTAADRVNLMKTIYTAAYNPGFQASLLPCGTIIQAAIEMSQRFLGAISTAVAKGFKSRNDDELSTAITGLREHMDTFKVQIPGAEGHAQVSMTDILDFMGRLVREKGLLMYEGPDYDNAITKAPMAFYIQSSQSAEIWSENRNWLDLDLTEARDMINKKALPVICPDKGGIRFKGPWNFAYKSDYSATPVCTFLSEHTITEYSGHIAGNCKANMVYDRTRGFEMKPGDTMGNGHFIMELDNNHVWSIRKYNGDLRKTVKTGIKRLKWLPADGHFIWELENGQEVGPHMFNPMVDQVVKAIILQGDGNLVSYFNYNPDTGMASGPFWSTGQLSGPLPDYNCFWVRLSEMFTDDGGCKLLISS
jgi:hypothetical protein